MFKIIPEGQSTIVQQLGELAAFAAPLVQAIVPDAQLPPPAERPFVQLAHSEIANDEADRIFAYAGIFRANAPIGIPGTFEPQFIGSSFLIFSLDGLEEHLRTVATETIAEYERATSFQAFLDSMDASAADYLIAGLMDCLHWCREHRAALAIRW